MRKHMSDIRKKGVVKIWTPERAFGWIQEPNGFRNFLHIHQCVDFVPEVGDEVTFIIGPGRKGPAAVDVRKVLSPLEQAAADLLAAASTDKVAL